MDEKRRALLKGLPKIDEVIGNLEKKGIYEKASREIVLETCRDVVQKLRNAILTAPDKQLPVLSAGVEAASRSVGALSTICAAASCAVWSTLGRDPAHQPRPRAPCAEAMERIRGSRPRLFQPEFDLAAASAACATTM
jgi:hypothetical protein